ncbi:MAG: nitroreductase [Chloroflexi bacterium]|nr:nitroreductase [Chloroflexota bacterium]
MEFQALIRARYSCRAYKPDPVPEEALKRVLQAAILAPTAANRQPFRLIVLRTAGREAELRRIYKADWLAQAPLVVCACGIPVETWVRMDGKNYNDVDVAIAMDHLILAAANEGLGTCWIGAFDPAAAREVLGLPEGVEPIALTPLGYPADAPRAKRRKSMDELVKWERWS